MGTVKPEKTHYSRNMSMVWGADPADGLWASLAVDSDGYLYAKTYVKDPGTLLWVPAVQGLKASDTLAVSGPLTDTQLRNTDVKVTLDSEKVSLTAEALPSGTNTIGKVNLIDGYGFSPEFTPNDEMRTITPYRIVGSTFSGTTLDSNYWTLANSAAGGTAPLLAGEMEVKSGATANNVTSVTSTRTARYIGGSSNRWRGIIRLPDVNTANIKRRWGVFNATDGAFFELDGTTFRIVTRKTTDTQVNSGSFNGAVASYTPTTNNTTYEIYYNNSKVYFVIGGVLIHTVTAATATWANTINLPARIESGNYNDSVTTTSIYSRNMVITRLGPAVTLPRYYYFAVGQTAGVVLKVGQGNIHSLLISQVSNTANVSIADAASGTTPLIWTSGGMGANTVPFPVPFGPVGCPFFNGLTLIVSGANAAVTVIYE